MDFQIAISHNLLCRESKFQRIKFTLLLQALHMVNSLEDRRKNTYHVEGQFHCTLIMYIKGY